MARGGIRWSDRREDFRTEILGLMKAQRVKNVVIVPTGAKGGFVLKRPPPAFFNATTSLVEALVLGLAVDDTIHFMTHYRQALIKTRQMAEAFNSIRDDAKGMVDQISDGALDVWERITNAWMKISRGDIADRFDAIGEGRQAHPHGTAVASIASANRCNSRGDSAGIGVNHSAGIL